MLREDNRTVTAGIMGMKYLSVDIGGLNIKGKVVNYGTQLTIITYAG